MEERFVFKNKQFRRLCVASMVIALAIAAVYMVGCFINFEHTTNNSRWLCRMVLAFLFAIETALFAHRNSIYMEIGGDFALARRSGSVMILLMIMSSLVEAYYTTVDFAGNMRIIYMVVILVIGCFSMLPLIEYQYLDLNFLFMRMLVIIGMVASVVSFCIGFYFIGLKEMETYQVQTFKEIVSRILDGVTPIYLINCLNGIIILVISHISLVKEQRKMSKFLPNDLSVDSFAAPQPEGEEDEDEDEDEEDDEEYVGL